VQKGNSQRGRRPPARLTAIFSAFAERLAALAEERAKPWWRRIILRAV
jgi:hypothetical protein